MTPASLRADIADAKAHGQDYIVLVLTGPYPRGLFRGELLCENSKGERVYRYKIKNVLAWLDKHDK